MKKIAICIGLLFWTLSSFTANAQDYPRGDVSQDGKVNIADVTYLIDYLLSGTWPEEDEHAWVDLGLPSGTLWATCNLGANSPEDYGDYFAWGETAPKDNYDWSTYKWCNGSYNTLTKYCTADNKTELDPEDDAAYVNWGPSWRMPTTEQQRELYEKCSSVWTTQNGVDGRLFTGSNGNTLFLPVTGERLGESLYYADSHGYYWSRTLRSSDPRRTYCLYFDSGYVGWSGNERDCGFAVRAVRELFRTLESFTANEQDYPRGDVNQDGTVTISDVTCLIDYLLSGSWSEEDEHAWVDLGLPSGTLWATCNMGASAPEEYGDYFAWGETAPMDYYDWSTYKWCNGDYDQLTKYCTQSSSGYNGFVDNKTELDPEDDAAYVNWGSSWRMPTTEQQQELYEQCSSVWTTQNGVDGRLFTGPNGNTLFLPAAGERWDDSLHYDGSWGLYWSRTLESGHPDHAYNLYFRSGAVYWSDDIRYRGFPVRPVRVSQN